MSSQKHLFTLTDRPAESVPSPDDPAYHDWLSSEFAAAADLLSESETWPVNHTRTEDGIDFIVRTAPARKNLGERRSWTLRESLHDDVSFELFESTSGAKLHEKQGQWDESLMGADRIRAIQEGRAEVWHKKIRVPRSSNRDFACLLVTGESESSPSTPVTPDSSAASVEDRLRCLIVVTHPYEHPNEKGFTRGRYESIEEIREVMKDDQKVVMWRSLLANDPGGFAPAKIVDRLIPSQLCSDGARFLKFAKEWDQKRRAAGSEDKAVNGNGQA